jgi:hypothetical protein
MPSRVTGESRRLPQHARRLTSSSSCAYLCARSPHADPLARAPDANLMDMRLSDEFDACASNFARRGRVGSVNDPPLAALVGEAVANAEIYREDTRGARKRRRR